MGKRCRPGIPTRDELVDQRFLQISSQKTAVDVNNYLENHWEEILLRTTPHPGHKWKNYPNSEHKEDLVNYDAQSETNSSPRNHTFIDDEAEDTDSESENILSSGPGRNTTFTHSEHDRSLLSDLKTYIESCEIFSLGGNRKNRFSLSNSENQ